MPDRRSKEFRARKFSLVFQATLLLVLAACLGCSRTTAKRVCIGKTCVMAEVVDTPEARMKGLMFRDSMPGDRGMLFVFEQEGKHGFWMKNMRFPVDILWIDSSKKITAIYQDALPCKDVCKTLAPAANAAFVLEVNAGFVAQHHLQVGDKAVF